MAAVSPAGPEPTITTLWTLMGKAAALLGHEGSGRRGCASGGGCSGACAGGVGGPGQGGERRFERSKVRTLDRKFERSNVRSPRSPAHAPAPGHPVTKPSSRPLTLARPMDPGGLVSQVVKGGTDLLGTEELVVDAMRDLLKDEIKR